MNASSSHPRPGTPFLALGCAFLPLGIATGQTAFLAVGLAFLGVAIALRTRKPTP